MLANLLGANWKTTVSGIGAAVFAGLTTLAGLPYELGSIAEILPPTWKPLIFKGSLAATILLKVWNSFAQKSKEVTGGTVQQDTSGSAASAAAQNRSPLIDATKAATPNS